MAPPEVPPGEHEAMITLAPSYMRQSPTKKFSVEDLPNHDIPWDDSIPSAERICMATRSLIRFSSTRMSLSIQRAPSPLSMRSLTRLTRIGAGGSPLLISPQIMREYLAVVTRPQATAPGLPMPSAIADVRRFRAVFHVAEDRASVLDRLIEILTTIARRPSGPRCEYRRDDAGLRSAPTADVQWRGFPAFRPLIEIDQLA